MIHLLHDPQAIKFTQGNSINLNLLKNEIDRRILKINTMITKFQDEPVITKRINGSVICCQSSCQTALQDKNIEIDFSQCSNNVLRNIDSNKLNAKTKISRFKYGESIKDSDYLILSGTNQSAANLKRTNKQKRNDYKSKDNSLLELDLQFSNIKFDQDISYQDQAHHIKSYIRQTLSNRKKFTLTDRRNVQSQLQPKNQSQLRVKTQKYSIKHDPFEMKELNRTVVSNECIEQMQKELQTLAKQKRMYQTDNKVRANILKKIEQKFKPSIS